MTKPLQKIKKPIVLILLFSVLSFSQLFAVDMDIGFQWDTYNPLKEKGVPGFSFCLSEALSENIKMMAKIDNLYGLNYNALAGVEIAGKVFEIAPAFLFALRSGAISPGVSLDGKINFGEKFSIGLLTDFAFSPKDFSKNSLMDLEGQLCFHTKNSDITVSYKYHHIFKAENVFHNVNSAKIDILAFEEGFPFKIDIFFGAGGYKHSDDATFFDLTVDVGGSLNFDFGKGGRYVLKGEAQPFKMLRTPEEKMPFAVSLAVGFTIE